jgi:dTDP-4-dehydrorhamnose 3,5-epimerase
MKFTETNCLGAWIIDVEEISDDRGFFARTFCRDEFRAHKLKDVTAQCNLSFNYQAGTLRGMHYQLPPASETKLVRCTQGAIFDIIVDLRPGSPTYMEHVGVELSAENRRSLYVPDLFAHGYQALTDNAEVIYQVTEFYTPGYERGIRHDDPALGLSWPLPVSVISDKDATWPVFDPEHPLW